MDVPGGEGVAGSRGIESIGGEPGGALRHPCATEQRPTLIRLYRNAFDAEIEQGANCLFQACAVRLVGQRS